MIRIPDLRHVRENHAVALFQSGHDFDRAYRGATELDVDSRRSVAVSIDAETWDFLVLDAVHGAPDLQNVVNFFDVDGAIHFDACFDSFGRCVECDVDRTSIRGAG